MNRWARSAALIALLFLVTIYVFSWLAPSVGLYHDDGVYAVTAKALAEGRGYRIISLPQEIPQTKYPFLFPAALSIIWRVWPDFPRNVIALKALPLSCALAWFVLSYKLLLRLGARKNQAFWLVLLTAASPLTIFLSTNLMSESMFGALFMGALLAANTSEHSNSDRIAWVAGILAALAFLTRTIGISLLVAIPLALVLRRRYAAVWRFGVAGAPLACIWPIWTSLHQIGVHIGEVYYSSANYSSWNILTNYAIGEKITILRTNIALLLLSPATLLTLPGSLWMVFLMLFLLLVTFSRGIPQLDAVRLSVTTYVVLVLCWAWPPQRFVVVILPLFLFLLWDTVLGIAQHRQIRRLVVGLAGLLICFVVIGDLARIPSTVSNGQFVFGYRPADNWGELTKVFSWLRNNTSRRSVLLANLDPALFLYTGRKSTRDFIPEARKLFYASGSPTDDSLGSLEDVIRDTSADFLIVTPDEGFAEMPVLRRNLAHIKTENPSELTLVQRPGSDPNYRIYRIHRKPCQSDLNLCDPYPLLHSSAEKPDR
jgi:hypothetical protein